MSRTSNPAVDEALDAFHFSVHNEPPLMKRTRWRVVVAAFDEALKGDLNEVERVELLDARSKFLQDYPV